MQRVHDELIYRTHACHVLLRAPPEDERPWTITATYGTVDLCVNVHACHFVNRPMPATYTHDDGALIELLYILSERRCGAGEFSRDR